MDSFQTDCTWQSLPPTYHFTLLPSLLVLFHMSKHFNDIGFQAFSGLAELMAKGSDGTEQSVLFRGGGGGSILRTCDGSAQGFSHYFPQKPQWVPNISYLSKWQFAHLMCVLWGPEWHPFIHPLCTNLMHFFLLLPFYILADNAHFISIRLCLFTAICCCNLLELSAVNDGACRHGPANGAPPPLPPALLLLWKACCPSFVTGRKRKTLQWRWRHRPPGGHAQGPDVLSERCRLSPPGSSWLKSSSCLGGGNTTAPVPSLIQG